MPFISFVIPVCNEEETIENSVRTIKKFLDKSGYSYEIIIANDGSTDKTTEIASRLALSCNKVRHLYSKKRLGKGGGIKNAFAKSKGRILIFEDVDLSAGVSYILDFIKEIKGGADICIGSRLLPNSKTKRTIMRKIFSLCYNLLIRILFDTRITDFQCGLKAFRRKCLSTIMETKDNGFFFDTELMLRSEKKGLKIVQIPITWEEKRKVKLNIVKTSIQMLYNLIKLRILGV